jgi:glycosyltransferase involved in cell wall biosynthesis
LVPVESGHVVAHVHRSRRGRALARGGGIVTTRLTIVRPGLLPPAAAANETVVPFDQLRGWIANGRLLAHLGRHGEGRLLVHRLESIGRPLPLALILRAASRGRIFVEDRSGRERTITAMQLARWAVAAAREPFRVRALIARVDKTVGELEHAKPDRAAALDLTASPLYLRTDLSFGVRAGGSVGHIAGVVNSLESFTGRPILLTTDEIVTLSSSVERHQLEAPEAFWNFRELPTFVLNDVFDAAADRHVFHRPLSFVYQRYSLNSYAGIRIARRYGVPLVMEYNGSEIWMSRHWGRPLKYETLSDRIERLNLTRPDLIVVVSKAMADEVIGRGADPRRVLVNPNGVDPERYRPDIDGRPVRARYALLDSIVIGFIGTFGPWHGAEMLARAFVELRRSRPAIAASLRLLMIGDGAAMPEVRRILADGGAAEASVLTGLVPQDEGPQFLAACDVLASPHVPNPDGSAFFGSPTKLFEYMAMGRGIVASDLDQIGEVLHHGRTAWLVPPGDVASLVSGLERLVCDRGLRETLGAAAREDAVAHHTWRQHTKRTVERLQQIVAPGQRG